ncbi:MAG: tetraacyldisaccharide 4'-kinase [Gallionellales bacterium GWA2_59_43]|nr:MAG: tetraacyldisaccharide 4'-kinase [Gallionellales bacterium GWA2_59_43]
MSGLERHWYRLTPLHLLLIPASLIFRLLAALRRALYRAGLLHSERLPVPVVVVGNINVGGAGKTPLTLALAQQLIEQGRHPLIVSRGHGGDSVQPRAVTPDSDPAQVGDEPLLMARRKLCPVWVGHDRAAAAHAGMQANPQCDVILCDDGLQHYRLQRDVEIAVVDGMRGYGNGWLLPAGPLREPVSRLRSVDAVVINGGDTAPGQFAMRLEGAVFHNLLDPGRTVEASHFIAARNHAVAGIGNPQRYFNHLEALGIRHTPHPFPDHHPYCANDLAFADCDAILLTEKDAVKCAPFADARYWMLRVEARIDPALIAHILRKIAPHGC